MDSPEEVTTYLIAGVLDREGSLAKTKLVKLLYLLDIDHFARYRRTITRFTWKYYFFGPYDSQIETVLRRIDLDIPQEEVQTTGGTRAVTFKPRNISDLFDQVRLSDRVRRSADRVLGRWSVEELYAILDHVYFHTEPMANARPGQTLDFAAVPEYQGPAPRAALQRQDQDTLRVLREQLATATARRLQLRNAAERQRSNLFREYDPKYPELMRRFAETEERSSGLDGTILVAPSWSEEAL